MSGLYLTSMADWLRAAGLTVVEYAGWQTRARSSGGFSGGKPWGVMWHHTASQTSPQNDADYMCKGSSDRPIANLLIARDGSVWVLAAGATNTNGKGGPWSWSKGTVSTDSMNTAAVGMEIANNGTGESFPQIQIDSAFATSIALVQALSLADTDICQHVNYAPTRKIDPAKAGAVQGPWQPRSTNSSGSWDLDDLTAEHVARCTYTPQEDDMSTGPATAWFGPQLHNFVRGSDGALWHNWFDNAMPNRPGWQPFESLGGQVAEDSAPSTTVTSDQARIDVTIIGTDGGLYQRWFINGEVNPDTGELWGWHDWYRIDTVP